MHLLLNLLVPAALAVSTFVDPTAADIIVGNSFGVEGGDPFEDAVGTEDVVTYVNLRGDKGLDYIQVVFKKSKGGQGNFTHGTPGGYDKYANINQFYPINRIDWGTDGTRITYLRMTTSEGATDKTVGGGVEFGAPPKNPGSEKAPTGHRFGGFKGHASKETIFNLQPLWVQ